MNIEQAIRSAMLRAADDLAQFDPTGEEFVVCGAADPDLTVGQRDGATRFEFRTIPTVYPQTAAHALAQRWNAANGADHPVVAVDARDWRAARLCRLADMLAAEAA